MRMKYEKWDEFAKKVYTSEEIEEAERKADLVTQLIESRKEVNAKRFGIYDWHKTACDCSFGKRESKRTDRNVIKSFVRVR